MSLLDESIGDAALLIEFGGSAVIMVACLRGLYTIASGRGTHLAIARGRLVVADGVISAANKRRSLTAPSSVSNCL